MNTVADPKTAEHIAKLKARVVANFARTCEGRGPSANEAAAFAVALAQIDGAIAALDGGFDL